MNTFLKVFLTQRLQFCVYFILDVQKLKGMSPIEYRLAHSKPTNNYFIPINLTLTNAIL
ncbi:hypothetical protein [Spiroplasma endosymbiont of Aleiodes alternator]|uniref:hypothetical protein n=1 Tax=Spiroplasma endosymbiont of Aleiodes alternator TaxID=3139329 RepID=UPI003CCB068A